MDLRPLQGAIKMRKCGLYCRTSGLALVLAMPLVASAAPAFAQDRAAPEENAEPKKDDQVVITGVRGSITDARNRKRKAKQIVDSVVAEDVGKLPDNNVPEALARVPGVQIDRVHGEGSSVTIRGLGDVQTTINGTEAGSAGSRALSLSDIPAELLKSVEVYKTRSADQPEGGIAGTVNVELRRPLDLRKGWTLAGSFRETFSDLGNTKSPYASVLVGKRFETPIGEMGLLLNGSYTRNTYNENFIAAESPYAVPADTTAGRSLPAALQGTIVPYAITYGVESGAIKRPSLNAAWQWRASDKLDFVLEGAYLGARETANQDYLKIVTNDGGGTYSNVVTNSDGTIRSLTSNNPNGVNGGPLSIYTKRDSDTYNANFETHWNGGHVRIDFGAQYNWSDSTNYFVQQQYRLSGATAVNVDFNSPNVPGGGPFVSYPGVDIANAANYKLFQVHDQNGDNHDTFFAGKLDFTVEASTTGLLRTFRFGTRFTKRTMNFIYGYRDAFYFNVANAPTLQSVSSALGIGLATTRPDTRGAGQIPTWNHFDNAQYFDRFSAVRQYLLTSGADLQGRDWTSATPGGNDPGQGFAETERTFAAYGEANYGFDVGFPVDGALGLRYVNTWGQAASTQYNWLLGPNGKIDPSFTLVMTQVPSKANYVDLLPSATAILHFSSKLQLRLSYTHNVQRPEFFAMRNFKELRDAVANPTGTVYAGNPDLKAVQENNYDASLEYYFGKSGMVSLGTFLKNQTGFIYSTRSPELVPELGSVHPVEKPRNAGPGKIFGLEGQVNVFFDFLPGIAKHFGINANATYIPVGQLHLYPDDQVPNVPGVFQPPFTSKYTGNVALIYDTPVLSARVAYNYRSSFKTNINYVDPGYSVYNKATSRLDAAVNVTPFKFVTFSLEATNLLKNNTYSYFGAFQSLPVGVREQARTVQLSTRVRF